MKNYIIALLLSVSCVAAMPGVEISQVMHNPSVEAGGEFVELHNNLPYSIDISGWRIATESSATDATIPDGVELQPYAFYLIADTGWDEAKDKEAWPSADHYETLSLTSSNAGVALYDGDRVVDAVGWGVVEEIDADLFEGDPMNAGEEGESLKRIKDTDNNVDDFEIVSAQPRNSSTVENASIATNAFMFIAEVLAPEFEIINATIEDDDSLQEGNQITPFPGEVRKINVDVKMTLDANITAQFLGEEISFIDEGNQSYNAELEIGYSHAAGEYLVEMIATDGYNVRYQNLTFSYLGLNAVEVDSKLIDLGAVEAATNVTESITIRNIGNTPAGIGISGIAKNIEDNSPLAVLYSIDSVQDAELTEELTDSGLTLGIGESAPLSLKLYVSPDTAEGIYAGQALVTAIAR